MHQQLDPQPSDPLDSPSGTSAPSRCLANESSPKNLITEGRRSVTLTQSIQIRRTYKDIRPLDTPAGPPGRGTRRFSSKDSCDRR
jgi:hypothetical protein